METISRAYATLREQGLTGSQYDFSQQWLGQSRSYFSAAKARKREPSLRSMRNRPLNPTLRGGYA